MPRDDDYNRINLISRCFPSELQLPTRRITDSDSSARVRSRRCALEDIKVRGMNRSSNGASSGVE